MGDNSNLKFIGHNDTCGLYVLYFVLMKSRGTRLSRVQQVFDTFRLRAIDDRVRVLVKNMLSRQR